MFLLQNVHFSKLVAGMTSDNIATLNIIVMFVIVLVALLTSMPVIWLEEHLWNFSVPQSIHLSDPVLLFILF
jgi:hypothetical protein